MTLVQSDSASSAQANITTHDIILTTSDGYPIAATVYIPAMSNQRAILLNSAMGVKQSYYADYAVWMAERGFVVLTYDNRGIGHSKHTPTLKKFPATLHNWVIDDHRAALDWLDTEYPTHQILVVGHSLGGQIAGVLPEMRRVTAWLGVASQSGYWRGWDGWLRVRMILLWYVLIPVLSRLYGYFPARLVGMGNNDLPANVVLEWARGGRHPLYLKHVFDAAGFDDFQQPMLFYSFSDDDFAPRQTVDNLCALYPNADSTHKHVKPADLGVTAIGHFGFFRKAFKDTLWVETAEWLEDQLPL
jgi:predicted alpha/beta hydrolase